MQKSLSKPTSEKGRNFPAALARLRIKVGTEAQKVNGMQQQSIFVPVEASVVRSNRKIPLGG